MTFVKDESPKKFSKKGEVLKFSKLEKIASDLSNQLSPNLKNYTRKFVLVKKKKDVPPPRSGGTIQVTFSHRPFKTPSRESKAPEEEEVRRDISV
jgi:hypothetical protein